MTDVSCFFAEFLGTAILAFMIMAATDKKNAAPPLSLLPIVIFLTLLGLGVALGMQTGTTRVAYVTPNENADTARGYYSFCVQPGSRFRSASLSFDGGLWKGIVQLQKVSSFFGLAGPDQVSWFSVPKNVVVGGQTCRAEVFFLLNGVLGHCAAAYRLATAFSLNVTNGVIF